MLCGELSRAKSAATASHVSEIARPGAPVWRERAFVIIGLRRNPPEWRYRLGVRTEDSQSSNPGSIPGSATKVINSLLPTIFSDTYGTEVVSEKVGCRWPAPKGAFDFERLTVSLKRYPDTKPF